MGGKHGNRRDFIKRSVATSTAVWLGTQSGLRAKLRPSSD